MKTPIQELIDRLKEERDLHGYDRGFIYETAIELAEAMLEKEEEVMCKFALSSFRQIKNNMVVKSAQMIVEEQYNQTFNTKEK